MADAADLPDEAQLTRNWTELVQEIRATQTGAQILTAFLLAPVSFHRILFRRRRRAWLSRPRTSAPESDSCCSRSR